MASLSDEKVAAAEQWKAYVSAQLGKGQARHQILQTMLAANWPQQQAYALIRETVFRIRAKSLAIMAGSGLFGLLALVVTLSSYAEASRSGGTYVIWWGGILVGTVGFVYGSSELIKTYA
jgi:hypothetical protein